jgi:SAM-dependent methyltransferase
MPDPEAERVRAVHARRDRLGLEGRYAYWQPDNLFIYQARERAVLELLGAAGLLPLNGLRVLDVGCGDGAVLLDMQRYGAAPADLHGIDLLPDRVESARAKLPAGHIDLGDARALPYGDAAFDLTLGFTIISFALDPAIRRAMAAEMLRVTRPGGLVLLYDFWTNPTNRNVRGLRRAEARRLFEGKRIDFRSTTLVPPLTRVLFRLPGGRVLCTLLDVLPFSRTHFVAAVHV